MPGRLPVKKVLNHPQFLKLKEKYRDNFHVSLGAEAIQYLLSKIDLEELNSELEHKLKESSSEVEKKSLKRQQDIVEAFLLTGSHPKYSAINVLPVVPVDLRPFAIINNNAFLRSDLGDLYRRVVNRNIRLSRLIELAAPEIIVRNEKRMLQVAVDALFDNGRHGRLIVDSKEKALVSIYQIFLNKREKTNNPTKTIDLALRNAQNDANNGKKQNLIIFTSTLKGLLLNLDESKVL